MLLPTYPLCSFFPLTFPILVLEGIKVTWKGHHFPVTGTLEMELLKYSVPPI